jgi:hypothetical protein
MGLARDLTMGPKRKRSPQPGTSPIYTRLRRLINTPAPDVDTADLKAAIEAVGAQPGRMRPAEGRLYNQACAYYRQLTGDKIGPETGTW